MEKYEAAENSINFAGKHFARIRKCLCPESK
jgi:hypothetical protein